MHNDIIRLEIMRLVLAVRIMIGLFSVNWQEIIAQPRRIPQTIVIGLEVSDDTSAGEPIYYDIDRFTSNATWLEDMEGMSGINSYGILNPDKIIQNIQVKILSIG